MNPYDLTQCVECLTQSETLRSDKQIHTGDKHYKCRQSGKCFKHPETLKSHQTLHTGVKRCECKQCGKRVNQGEKLQEHEQSHTREEVTSHYAPCDKNSFDYDNSNANCGAQSVRKGIASTVSSNVRELKQGFFECWICLEELDSRALLLDHYDNHMK